MIAVRNVRGITTGILALAAGWVTLGAPIIPW
jgi:hypothetical protein